MHSLRSHTWNRWLQVFIFALFLIDSFGNSWHHVCSRSTFEVLDMFQGHLTDECIVMEHFFNGQNATCWSDGLLSTCSHHWQFIRLLGTPSFDWIVRSLVQMLRNFRLVHSAQNHVLLHFFDLHELTRQVLVRGMELKVSFEVHLGSLSDLMSHYEFFHMQTILLCLLFSLTSQCLWVFLLEVFKDKFLFLAVKTIVCNNWRFFTFWI